MAFTFKHGDRVLDQYTIQRGVGRGGFGEVYYAVSDGGREVAIKYLRDNPHVELRGVNHCINLKSPHLVSIFDVRKSDAGEYFIIMEYISGPSLRDLLVAEPNGLGVQKAAFFLREIGKGLAYLHDRGIVHRDLKPGNIFFDDSYVKIGDYGLSKFISVSRHSAQTASVGTVHYMAPEVGSGQYSKSIDVYALGVMLYEMLLGRVPFEGSSMGEVLMKHLTAQPEVDALPAPFADVIRKALAKDPKDRYQTVHEMLQDVFSEETVQQSIAGFNPELSLSGAARAVFADGSSFPQPSPNPPPRAWNAMPDALAAAASREAGAPGVAPGGAPIIPRRERFQRMLLSGFMAVGMSVLAGLIAGIMTEFRSEELAASVGLMTFAGSGGLLIGRRVLGWLGAAAYPVWAKRVVLLTCAGAPLAIGAAPLLSDGRWDQSGGAMLISLLIAVMFFDWQGTLRYGAGGAMNLSDAFRKGFGTFAVAAPITGMFNGEAAAMFASGFISLSISLILQAAGWWLQSRVPVPPPPPTKRDALPPLPQPPGAPTLARRIGAQLSTAACRFESRLETMAQRISARSGAAPRSPEAAGAGTPRECGIPFAVPLDAPVPDAAAASAVPMPALRGGFARAFWSIVAFAMLIGAFVNIVVMASMGHRISTPQVPVIGLVGCVLWSLFALSKTTARRRLGFWRETLRPFLLAAAATGIGTSITFIASPPATRSYVNHTVGVGAAMHTESIIQYRRNTNVRNAMIPTLVLASLCFVTVGLARGRRTAARPFLISDSSSGGSATH
ncbi:MAG: serine/threonine protein kinase [Phycisphaerales bacterium]|nr:serine/threonine protein kinase [Phycisphaerales bacterium]